MLIDSQVDKMVRIDKIEVDEMIGLMENQKQHNQIKKYGGIVCVEFLPIYKIINLQNIDRRQPWTIQLEN